MVDLVKITLHAGSGGSGAVSFRREKYKPKGPPDGGDGGKGGDVYLVADTNLSTLYDFRRKRVFKADDGKRGGRNNRSGKNGADLYLRVPVGTEVKVKVKGQKLKVADLVEDGQVLLVARGGGGGRGNAKLRTRYTRAPKRAESGIKGEVKELILELKLIADVGLIGLPNAGKSTLLNVLTKAKAKIGSYPFTTLAPNLGVMFFKKTHFVLADIPGLIEGASKGKGLGDQFLRHIERTKILVHVIDPTQPTNRVAIIESYQTIRKELNQYSPKLLEKPEIAAINKLDQPEAKKAFPDIKKAFKKQGIEVLGISALTTLGLDKLKEKIIKELKTVSAKVTVKELEPLPIFTIDNLPNKKIIFKY